MEKIKNNRLIEESKVFAIATPIILAVNYFIFTDMVDLNSKYTILYIFLILIISTFFIVSNFLKTDYSKKYIYNSLKNLFFLYLIYSLFISISSLYFIKDKDQNPHKSFLLAYVGTIILTTIYHYIKTKNKYEIDIFFKINIEETDEYLLMNGEPQFHKNKNENDSEISKKLKSMLFSIALPVSTMAYPLQKLIVNQYGEQTIFLFLTLLGFVLHMYAAKGLGYYLFSNIVTPLRISKQHGKPIYFHRNF